MKLHLASFSLPLVLFVPLLAFSLSLVPPSTTTTSDLSPVPTANVRHSSTASLFPPAKRALILPVILSGYMTIDGGADHILAVSEPARNLADLGLMGKVYPALYSLPTIGSTVAPADPERIVFLRSDAVFVWAEQAEPLRNIGLPGLVAVNINPRDQMASRIAMWRVMGEAAGKQEQAEALLTRYFAKREELRGRIAALSLPKPRVAVLYRVGKEYWGIGGKTYNLNDRLEVAGAANVAAQARISGGVDLEQLLLLNPDILLLNSGPAEDWPDSLYSRPEWNLLRAVRQHKVYKMPVYSYMNAVINMPVEDPLLLEWMAEIFYPGSMLHNLRNDFQETYRTVYHYAVSDDEIDKAIYMDANLGSAGYERFSRSNAGLQQ